MIVKWPEKPTKNEKKASYELLAMNLYWEQYITKSLSRAKSFLLI